jgi:hypothetical protein
MSNSSKYRSGARIAALFVALVAGAAAFGGCDSGNEGSRCNPFLSHDECGDGLVCSGPGTSHALPGNCVENYCCPADPTKSSIPYCNGTDTTCAAPDAGSTGDDGGDAAPESDASDAAPEASSGDASNASPGHDAASDAPGGDAADAAPDSSSGDAGDAGPG